ncbi:MAG TPA: tripartite tricarboxylate transporter substrate-binding protein, partial [Burkholderiaceae bacterium]|nr:tripartite tricarboxylate transporter substrate-binding protein [Burkholderiaceae bacterium]
GGRLSGMMLNVLTAKPHVDAGKLRALGLTSQEPSAAMPGVPTIAQSGLPGYEALQWFGLLAPGGTPEPILERLQALILAAMNTPEMQDRLSKDGAYHVPNTPREFAAVIHYEIDKWTKLAKAINLQPQ